MSSQVSQAVPDAPSKGGQPAPSLMKGAWPSMKSNQRLALFPSLLQAAARRGFLKDRSRWPLPYLKDLLQHVQPTGPKPPV